jgi:hypothetical protein
VVVPGHDEGEPLVRPLQVLVGLVLLVGETIVLKGELFVATVREGELPFLRATSLEALRADGLVLVVAKVTDEVQVL